METNNGVDVTFDIIVKNSSLYSSNAKVTYKGITSTPDYVTQVTIDKAGNFNISLWSYISPTTNANDNVYNLTSYSSVHNITNDQLTTSVGFSSVTGYLSNAANIITFTAPVIIDRVK